MSITEKEHEEAWLSKEIHLLKSCLLLYFKRVQSIDK